MPQPTGTERLRVREKITSHFGIKVRYNHVVKTISRNRRLKGKINRIKKRILNNHRLKVGGFKIAD